MRAIDTNVLVRLLTRDDARQTQKAESFIADGAWVSLLVLAECVWVLESLYDLKREQIRTLVTMLLEHQQLVLQDADTIRQALESFSAGRGVGFSDCMVLAIAAANGHTPLGTFDKKLSKLESAQAL